MENRRTSMEEKVYTAIDGPSHPMALRRAVAFLCSAPRWKIAVVYDFGNNKSANPEFVMMFEQWKQYAPLYLADY